MMLPGILSDIADVAGEEAARKVAQVRGGKRTYFPPVPRADHWLAKLIGLEAARAVCDRLTAGVGPLRIDVPMGEFSAYRAESRERYTRMDQMIHGQRSALDIVRATGYTERTVRRRRARLGKPADARQTSLF